MTKQTRYVGIDYGTARLGLSVSDPTKLIAMPLTTLVADKKGESTATKLLKYLDEYALNSNCQIERIIIGMPLTMSGKRGFIADEVHHFIDILKAKTAIAIIPWDERLTSVQAEKSLREGGLNRKKRAKAVDSVAALILLQSYLDANPSSLI